MSNWRQSCEEAKHAGDINDLTESMSELKEHRYYQTMRQLLIQNAKQRLKCDFNKEYNKWFSPKEFMAITDEQRNELQDFINERGLDAKTVCEHLGIDALNQIEESNLQAVKNEIENLAKLEMETA